MKTNTSKWQSLAGIATIALVAPVLQAQTSALQTQPGAKQGPTVVVGIGAEHTDNAYKFDLLKQSETKEYVSLDLGYLHSGQAFEADILYNGEFANYEHDTTQDDSVIQGRSSLTWHALPGRFSWDASHERSEQIQDSRNPDIRNNRILRDIVSTGPTFTARMGSVDDLILSGRYMDVSYQDSDRIQVPNARNADSSRWQGAASWQHRLSSTDLLSLSYSYMDTDFDGAIDDFQFQRVFGTYAVHLASGGYSISLGANKSERDRGQSMNGFFGQISWNLATEGHRFDLSAIKELTDSGIGLGGNSLGGGANFRPRDSNFDVIDMVERTSIDLNYGYDRVCERCTVDFGVGYDKQDFDTEPRDQERFDIRASFGYRLTPTLKASLLAGYGETDFSEGPSGGRTDERTQYALDLNWMLSRSLSLSAWLNKDERDSDRGNNDYDELFGGISIRYTFR